MARLLTARGEAQGRTITQIHAEDARKSLAGCGLLTQELRHAI